jgi:gas vesicle protein
MLEAIQEFFNNYSGLIIAGTVIGLIILTPKIKKGLRKLKTKIIKKENKTQDTSYELAKKELMKDISEKPTNANVIELINNSRPKVQQEIKKLNEIMNIEFEELHKELKELQMQERTIELFAAELKQLFNRITYRRIQVTQRMVEIEKKIKKNN